MSCTLRVRTERNFGLLNYLDERQRFLFGFFLLFFRLRAARAESMAAIAHRLAVEMLEW
jgi:hypothetical protein